MGINTIASKTIKIVRDYMREQARELNARNCNIDYGHTVFDDYKSIDAYVYPCGENALRAFIVLSDSCGDVLNIYSDTVRVDNICPVYAIGTDYLANWVRRFFDDYFIDMWNSARDIIDERERVKRLVEIRDDVEFRAVVND